jgi:zinc transporter, ZIP family
VAAALGWGALAASSLVIGALIGLARPWPLRAVGLVLGFGAGALISAVSFELAEEGVRLAGALPVAIGLGVGAITYYVASAQVASMGGGSALALGAFLDGIPEQMVLGIGLAGGATVSAGLLAAIFVSNLPEAIGGATDMRRQMHSVRQVALNWVGASTASRPAPCS